MLLFNFICVFYLMVLVNSHTISKSIAEYKFDDESDSLTDIDYNTRGRKNRHDVFLHKFRRREKESLTEPIGEKTTIAEITTLKPTTETPKAHGKTKAHHKFWRKFKMKNKKAGNDRRKRYKHKLITINPRYPNRITAHENYRLSHDGKRKRDASVIVDAKLNRIIRKDKTDRISTTDNTLDTLKTRSTLTSTTEDKAISDMTTKLTSMKLRYGTDKYRFIPKFNKVFYEFKPYPDSITLNSQSTTEETEFPGTAQIEELLNDIKARAIQMIADQNPGITELLTNAVTEATFEADPILTHIAGTSPGFALTTFVSLSDMDDINKRTVNNSNMVVISDNDSHNMSVRSCKQEVYTVAQNVEDMLQHQLKKIYKKVKSKVAKDYHKEVKTVQSTLSDQKKKVVDKIDKKIKQVSKSTKPQSKSTKCKSEESKKCTKTTTNTPSPKTRHVRAGKVTKKMKKPTAYQETTPTIDDFAMLTLYEQILYKTHEDNVMKMLTTNAVKELDGRLSKRNPTPDMTDAPLLYDEITVSNSDAENATNDFPSQRPDYNATGSTDSVEDTGYEGLVDKISFNDYVNGYKHYLKFQKDFQKDQAEANFSNLIKFQAHKHHKVDDIGKFILNKIPQLPTRKRRYFFDDSDIDYQDVSTKSDDSWFKKHFYMFIDNGPPKKYHTSETVNFKAVTGDNTNKVGFVSRTIENSMEGVTEFGKIGIHQDQSKQDSINLDDLSKELEDHKYSFFSASRPQQENPVPSPRPEEERLEEGGLAIKIYAPQVLSKWFGSKQSRKLKKSANNKGDDTFNDPERLKRDVNLPKLHNLTSNLEVRNKVDAAPRTDKPKAANKKKDGCVSIDVVSQPTSVVKLRSNNQNSKFKKLLRKLHLIRNKKKQKRQAKIRRFNPFKKLKDMFRNNDDSRPMGIARGDSLDYEIFSSHIDTFKPVKYNIPNLNDLKNQIPNITNEFGLPYDDHLRTLGETGMKEKVVDVEYEKDISPHLEKPDTKAYTYGTHNPARTFTKTTPKKRTMTRRTTTLSLAPSLDDIMSINIKTSSNISQIDKPVQPDPLAHHMSLQDIKNEIEKLNKKISHGTPENPYLMITQPNQNAPANPIITLNRKNLIKPKSQRLNKNQGKKTFSVKKPVNIQHKKYVSDNSALYKFDKNNNLRKINGEFSDTNTNNIIIDRGIVLSTTEFPNKMEDLKMNTYKNYRDDFNELLLWHGDILNYDSLTSPSWQDVLNNLQNNNYTTPNVVSMQNELAEMNHLLKNYKENTFAFAQEKDYIENNANSTKNIKHKGNKVKVSNYNKKKRGYDFNDRNLKTMTVITENYENGPNEYYTTKDYVKKDIGRSRSREEFLESIIMDTTIMSYDDSVNFITENPRKISRSSLKPSKKKNKSSENKPKTKTKTNPQPQQSFSTPFPMTMGQFELFLKQNDLDVETVTAPIKDAPNLLDIHSLKPNTNASIHKKVDKNIHKDPTSETLDDVDPEDQIEYLNQELEYLESDLNYLNDYSDKNRHRKSSRDETTKRPATKKRNTLKDKEVEITIINFDDANKLFQELNTLKAKYQEAQDKSTTIAQAEEKLTTFAPKLILTNKMKPGHNIVRINGDSFRKHSKTTKIDEDANGLHVYGNSFHYNFLFEPNKKLKGQLLAAKRKLKKSSTHSEVDNGDNGDRILMEEIQLHRFGRKAETAKPMVTSATTEQAAAMVTQLWSRFIPILRSKISLFAKNSTSKKKEKSNSTSTEKVKSKSTSKVTSSTPAITKTLMRKDKTTSKKHRIFVDEDVDKYNNIKEVTAPLPVDVSVMEHDHNYMMTTIKHKTKTKGYKKEEMYVEEAPPDDMIYYEFALKKHPLNLKANKKTTPSTTYFYSLFEEVKDLKAKLKRNAPEDKYTAKDVAAIEVVVDLLKNTLNGVTKPANTFLLNPKEDKTTTTNSIQVHIAIPYEIDDKKRSADSQRIRKVFSAKMATPVDLEYQIHSIEQGNATPSNEDAALAPGMYLVVDNKTGSYSLKPVKYNKQTRELQKNLKQSNISKVALSKDFLATINEQLLKLYENLTANINNHKIVSRHVHWDKIKQFFGHDRVCNCKCKANRTMCRACAASDDVVKELTIAFENLSKYMTDHCTEIQTFFWMNPTGGKKLRDLVNRIDGSLSDYYKRVKGKCQGRPCKTFSTYLDKRGVNKSHDELKTFLDCIKELSQNIEMVLISLPYDDNLKDAGEKFVEITNNCAKSLDKRRFQDKKSEKKQNEYSLDNINVNIICDPNARKNTGYKFSPTELAAINCDLDNNKQKKTLKTFFCRTKNRPRNKLFTYYITADETPADQADETPKMDKRETFANQLESPLIADTGGSFWQDYIGKNNYLETLIKSGKTKEKTKATSTKKENNRETTMKSTKSFKDKIKNMYPSKLFPTPTNKVHKITQASSTPTSKVTAAEDILVTEMESLSYNIQELMNIFEKVYHFENYKKERNNTESTAHRKTTKHKQTKAKKIKKIHKTTTAKMHKKDKHKYTEHTKHHAAATTKNKALKANITPKDEIKIISTEERNKHHHLTNMIESPSVTTSVSSTPVKFPKETNATRKQPQTVNTTVETEIETKKKCESKKTTKAANRTVETKAESKKICQPKKSTQKEVKNNIFHKLKHVTAGLFDGIKHRLTTTIPKRNRETDISEIDNKEHKTQGTVFTKGNNEEVGENNNSLLLPQQTNKNNNKEEASELTQTSIQNNIETGEHNNNLLFSQQTNDNYKEETERPTENYLESNEINTDTTTELTSLINNIEEDGQRHVISQETTTGISSILILTPKPNEGKDYNELLKSVLDFDNKLKRQNEERTMMDVEDIMMTYTANLWTTKTKEHNKQKSSTKPRTNKHTDKHTNKQPDKTTEDSEYDLVDIFRTLQLPTPTSMKDDQNGLFGFSIKVVPDTKNTKGSHPSKSTTKT